MPDRRARRFQLWDVRPGERARTALMFTCVMLLIAAYTTTKAVRDAVFLSRWGLTELSWLMLGIAVLAGFVVSVLTRVTAGVPRHLLLWGTSLLVAVTLVALAPELRAGDWTAWALYVWSGVFGLLLVAELWLLANELFHAREARRLFPLIGAGAILGGVVGGGLSAWLARPLGSARLLYLVAGELVLAPLCGHLAWRLRPAGTDGERPRSVDEPRLAAGLVLVRRHPYVRLLALMMVCMTVCLTFVQWQYKGIAKLHFGARQDDLTWFFGLLAAGLNAGSFLVQLLVTPRLLGRFGVKAGLRLLPLGVLAGSVVLLAAGGLPDLLLVAAAGAVLTADGLRFSVDKASVELLYLPLPREIKDQAKPFVDTVTDRFAGALAALLWLALTFTLHIDRPERIAWASVVVLALVGVWLWAIARVRRGYVEAYRRLVSPSSARSSPPAAPLCDELAERLSALAQLDDGARTRAVRGLSRLQRSFPDLRVPVEALEPHLQRETATLRALGQARAALPRLGARPGNPLPAGDDGERGAVRLDGLLARAVNEQLAAALERVARLLQLAYGPGDIGGAFRTLREGHARARAGAIELLDNLLDLEGQPALLRALDDVTLAGPAPGPPDDDGGATVLAALATLDDEWLRTLLPHLVCASRQAPDDPPALGRWLEGEPA